MLFHTFSSIQYDSLLVHVDFPSFPCTNFIMVLVYFFPAQVPERVRAMNATIKLLLIVREPVTRAISDYTQLRSHAATATLPQQPPISQQQEQQQQQQQQSLQSSVPMSVTSAAAASSSTPSLSAASK